MIRIAPHRAAQLLALVALLGPASHAAAQPPAEPPPGDPAAELERAYARVIAVAGGLTADQAGARAAARSPSLAARREDVAIAASELTATRLDFLPRTSVTGRYTRLGPTDDAVLEIEPLPQPIALPGPPADQWWFGGQMAVPLSDYVLRLGHAVAARRHSALAAEWMSQAERRRVAAEARLAYYDWARATLGILVAERSRDQAARHERLAERRAAQNTATRADRLLAEARLAEAEDHLARTRLDADLAARRLRIAIGEPSAPLAIGEDVLAPLPPADADADRLFPAALAARPELRALGQSAGAIERRSDLEAARRYPRLDLVGTLARANPNPRAFPPADDFETIWDASAVLTWSFDDIPRANEKRRELAARRRQVDDQRRQLTDGILLEVTRAAQEVRAAETAIETRRRALTAAEEGHRVRERLFEVGSATGTELVDAATDLTRARFALLDAHITLRKAGVALDLATGR